MTKLSGIDANLATALDALLRQRSVTRAAAELGFGQPALSHSLARLRDHFKDPLLIQRGRELVLSERAIRLLPQAAAARAALATLFEQRPALDLSTPRAFVLASADLFSLRFIPEIERRLRREAPGIELEVRALAGRSSELILSDGVELAFGAFEDVPQALNQQHLFRDPFVCAVRADHPRIGKTLSLKTYVELPHLEVVPAPHARPGARIDRLLAAKGLHRRVTARVPYFLLAARILETSDQVLTMTQAFAKQLAQLASLRILKCPLVLPPLLFSQIWAHRHDSAPTHRFLRELCFQVCGGDASQY